MVMECLFPREHVIYIYICLGSELEHARWKRTCKLSTFMCRRPVQLLVERVDWSEQS